MGHKWFVLLIVFLFVVPPSSSSSSSSSSGALHRGHVLSSSSSSSGLPLNVNPSIFAAMRSLYGATVCNVVQYGAVGDGKHDDTHAINKAMAACAKGGTLLFPYKKGKGSVYRSQALTITTSNLEVNIENGAMLKFFNDIKTWPVEDGGVLPCILAKDVKNLQFRGGGRIDGSGAPWWKAFSNGSLKYGRPLLIYTDNVQGLLVEDMFLTNSPQFHIVPNKYTSNVVIRRITIHTPYDLPGVSVEDAHNTDGIDPGSNGVLVEDSWISDGDDNVVAKPGCKNMLVQNCYFGYGHGASIGSLNHNDAITNVTFRNIVMNGTSNACRIKAHRTWKGVVSAITYYNISMTNIDHAIRVTTFYEKPTTGTPTGTITNINITDVRGATINKVGEFMCGKKCTCDNITMDNVHFKDYKKDWLCSYAYGTAHDVSPQVCLKAK
eukprot:TRINITY_DN57193_c1_g1_i1.p1 TRINITY_DN57193_c1_g1~~TRINITY_DN57193_c1_g1_i1.p1  ORF type:complete len:436 (+),score=30.35 TRINITY_DN57193_c1_g1_i1:36-1343(+)